MDEQYQGGFNPDPVQGQVSGEAIGNDGAGNEQPKYLTPADLAAFEQKIERRLQSLNDKQQNRLEKVVNERIGQMEARYQQVGQKLPDHVRQRIIDDAISNYSEDGEQPAQGAPSRVPPDVETVNRQAADILKGAGISWDDMTMREVNSLKQTTPEAYLESVRQAAASAVKRLGVAAPQQQPNLAAAPAIGAGQPAGGDLEEQYRKEVIAARGKGNNVLMDIKKRYRERGIDVDGVKVFNR